MYLWQWELAVKKEVPGGTSGLGSNTPCDCCILQHCRGMGRRCWCVLYKEENKEKERKKKMSPPVLKKVEERERRRKRTDDELREAARVEKLRAAVKSAREKRARAKEQDARQKRNCKGKLR